MRLEVSRADKSMDFKLLQPENMFRMVDVFDRSNPVRSALCNRVHSLNRLAPDGTTTVSETTAVLIISAMFFQGTLSEYT